MHDSFERFIEQCTDPYWVVLATFISGLAIGFLISSFSTAADYVVQLIHRRKIKKNGSDGGAQDG